MATHTTNYNWVKPSYEDDADIEVLNSTFDSIDAQMKSNDDKISSPLVQLVDDGPKNRIKLGFPTTTKNAVTATANSDGTITLSGTNSSTSSTILVFDLYANAAASTDNKQNPFIANGKYIMKGSGSNIVRIQFYGYNDDLQLSVLANSADDVEVTIDGTYKYYVFRIWIAGSASFDNVVLSPMCCLKDFYDISSAFRPYTPSSSELYDMIKAIQQ